MLWVVLWSGSQFSDDGRAALEIAVHIKNFLPSTPRGVPTGNFDQAAIYFILQNQNGGSKAGAP